MLNETRKKMISIDETAINITTAQRWGWHIKGTPRSKSILQRFSNITMINAITEDGRHFYCLLLGGHNQWSYIQFLKMLV